MSTRPAKGCQNKKGCIHVGIKTSGTTIPESGETSTGAIFAARRVFNAVTAMLNRTVNADERITVSEIETANRPAACGEDGMCQLHAPSPMSGSTMAAATNIGTTRKLL